MRVMGLAKTSVAAAGALLGALTVAAACSHTPERLAAQDNVGLFLNEAAGSATLAYGVANSDSVGLMLQCRAGSRRISVSDVARSPSADRLTLISGDARSDLPATLDQTTGLPTLYAQASGTDRALKAFRQSGKIAVKTRGGAYALEARPSERDRVERFFETCERA